MSKGVFTRMKRFQFVEKTAGEVGADKIYSTPITVAQLEELFYRVRDAKFVSGSVRVGGDLVDPDEGETGSFEVRATGYDPGEALAEEGEGSGFVDFDTPSLSGYFSQRAYCMEDYEGRPAAITNFNDYFSSSYTLTEGTYRDLENERGMWIPGSSDYIFVYGMESVTNSMNTTGYVAGFTGSNYNEDEDQVLADTITPGYNISVFRECTTGFSTFLTADSYDFEDFYGFTSAASLEFRQQFVGYVEVSLSFSKQVAWVDLDGSGNPLSSGNELWIPVYFFLNTDDAGLSLGSALRFHSQLASVPGSSVCDLVLVMASGSVRTPLFVEPVDFMTSVTESGTDFVVQATKWWPYAKDSPAVPVWDVDTGLKL